MGKKICQWDVGRAECKVLWLLCSVFWWICRGSHLCCDPAKQVSMETTLWCNRASHHLGKGGSLRGYPQPGWFLKNFNPITALENIWSVVLTVYPSLFYDQKTYERAIWTRPVRQRSPLTTKQIERVFGSPSVPQAGIRHAYSDDSSCWEEESCLLLLTWLLFPVPTMQQRNQRFNTGPQLCIQVTSSLKSPSGPKVRRISPVTQAITPQFPQHQSW